jgi:hypothetical protein
MGGRAKKHPCVDCGYSCHLVASRCKKCDLANRSGRKAKPLSERFPRLLEMHAQRVGGCIFWRGRHGFRGRLKRDDGSYAAVYTLLWEQTNGPLPSGFQINHHCDNHGCLNLDHMYAGTQTENNRDREVRNRGWWVKFTPEERSAIAKKRWETRRENAKRRN